MLKITDFTKEELGYLSYKFDGFEICLEPCLNGFDVAIYKDMELLEPKFCTDVEKTTLFFEVSCALAMNKARELYQKYKK